jgi:OPA family glycerol-3-phosphate transporter-like MFS transporter
MTSSAKLAQEVIPVLVVLAAVSVVVRRVSAVAMDHPDGFRQRRRWNWLLLGVTYAFLYMGRFNLVALKDAGIISREEFGRIDAIGGLTYGISFLINGPLADRLGGRFAMLFSVAGAAIANALIGVEVGTGSPDTRVIAALFAANMYFQSSGAVSTVKVNGAWFHVRERGVFGGVFGVMIAIGLYLAFDWVPIVGRALDVRWMFYLPALILALLFAVCACVLHGAPPARRWPGFDTGDAAHREHDPAPSTLVLLARALAHPVIMTMAAIGMCSGFLRHGILTWYRDFATGVGSDGSFVHAHWGMVVCIAGIAGGMAAGLLSDRLFQSRRGPVAAVLYAVLLVCAAAALCLTASPYDLGPLIAVMAMAAIGVHGILAGVATQDFGGRARTGTVAGLVDGFVYVGTAIQALVFGSLLPARGSAAAVSPSSWYAWPGAMLPVTAIGLVLALRLWNARAGR